jgi:competence protein ComEC
MNNFNVRQVWRSNLPIDLEDYPEWEKAIKLNNINVSLVSNHGYEPQSKLRSSYPPLRGIVQHTNSAALRFRNWSFNNKSPEKIFNAFRVNVLWPSNYSAQETNNLSYDEVNDASLVLKITFGKISFLIPGDISADVEKRLIESKIDLRSDVLVVPHHGSGYSSSAEFIKAVACRYAIISAGKANVFHHPHPSTLQRYNDASVNIFRTDRDGAVTITTDGNDLQINTFIKQ